jgi:iduronate 2-sulfatase
VGFYRPHTPYVAPAEYFKHYPPEEMPLHDDVEADVADLPPAALQSHKKEHELLNDDLRRQAIQAYYASTTFMDAQVGKVLKTLRETGLDRNTIVVFTSDHGYHLGAKGLWQKMSLFEESAGVPMIIALPKDDPRSQQGGNVCQSPVGLIDLYPTLVDLCDVKVSQELHGQSLAPMLADASELGRGYTISQVMRGGKSNSFDGYTIRDSRYHLTLWDDGKKGIELYDHQNDPLEKDNLAVRDGNPNRKTDDAKTLAIIDGLTAKLDAERAKAMPAEGRPPVKRLPRIPYLVSP